MGPSARRNASAVVVGSVVTVVTTVVLLRGAVGRGQLLYRDFVSVPHPVLSARTFGFDGSAPRAVPLDAVTAILATAVPAGVQQQVMLVATLLLAGVGVTVLLRSQGPVATASGAAFMNWSPYAGERLLVGQPPTLLAWSMLPWLVLAARSRARGWRWLVLVLLAAAPAALTPFGGVVALVVVLVVVLVEGQQSRRAVVGAGLLGLAWCLPWLVPALAGRTGAGAEEGSPAFAVDAATPGGVLDVVSGGGIWSTGAQLASREGVPALLASLALLLLAVVGLLSLGRLRVLAAVAAVAPPLVALGLAVGPGLTIFTRAQSIPGVAIFRDTHRLLAISAFTVAVLAALGIAVLARSLRARRGAVPAVAATLVAFSLAVLTAPDLASRLHRAYRPVVFPSTWSAVAGEIGDHHALVLPWQPFRQTAWSGGQPFLDPLPLAVSGTLVSAQDLVVVRHGQTFRVGASDPAEAMEWAAGRVDASDLRRRGVDRVVEWLGTPGVVPVEHLGMRLVREDADFRVWAVTG